MRLSAISADERRLWLKDPVTMAVLDELQDEMESYTQATVNGAASGVPEHAVRTSAGAACALERFYDRINNFQETDPNDH